VRKIGQFRPVRLLDWSNFVFNAKEVIGKCRFGQRLSAK
jgi:hypothetical protein